MCWGPSRWGVLRGGPSRRGVLCGGRGVRSESSKGTLANTPVLFRMRWDPSQPLSPSIDRTSNVPTWSLVSLLPSYFHTERSVTFWAASSHLTALPSPRPVIPPSPSGGFGPVRGCGPFRLRRPRVRRVPDSYLQGGPPPVLRHISPPSETHSPLWSGLHVQITSLSFLGPLCLASTEGFVVGRD